MKKIFCVSVDITMAKNIYVKAENLLQLFVFGEAIYG